MRWLRRAERRSEAQEPTPDRDASFLPGDIVRITLSESDRKGICSEFHDRHGVVTYGPDRDSNPGWLISSAPGSIRCVGEELTMITRREDR